MLELQRLSWQTELSCSPGTREPDTTSIPPYMPSLLTIVEPNTRNLRAIQST